MNVYKGQALKGEWLVTLKVDGVKVIIEGGIAKSRAGKPLYNIPPMPDGIYEAYINSWEETVSRVRTHEGTQLEPRDLIRLYPPDPRLIVGTLYDPLPITITRLFDREVQLGVEGLVLRGPKGKEFKVKPIETLDLPILGVIEGKGKYQGKMGALITPLGNVGTGFTDLEREQKWGEGMIIEVAFMGYTPSGSLRHPRYIRSRFDK